MLLSVLSHSNLEQIELNLLRATQDKNEADFNAHAEQARERLDALDNQMRSTQSALTERAGELSALTTRLQGLGNIMEVLQEHNALASRVDELVKEVGAAKDMLQGLSMSPPLL